MSTCYGKADRVVLTSRRLRLTGRPDRLIKAPGTIVPEECDIAVNVIEGDRVVKD